MARSQAEKLTKNMDKVCEAGSGGIGDGGTGGRRRRVDRGWAARERLPVSCRCACPLTIFWHSICSSSALNPLTFHNTLASGVPPASAATTFSPTCRSAAWRRRSVNPSWWSPTRPRASCSWRRTRCTACRWVGRGPLIGGARACLPACALCPPVCACLPTCRACPPACMPAWMHACVLWFSPWCVCPCCSFNGRVFFLPCAGGTGEDSVRAAGQAG